MKYSLRVCLALLTGLLMVVEGVTAFAGDEPAEDTLQLFGRSRLGEHQVGLSESDWSWLRKKARSTSGFQHRITRHST
nr:hypothetical protein [Pseudomonas sp. BIGb0427]